AAVVSYRAGEAAEIAGREERHAAAHAVADNADLAGALRGLDRRRRVAQHRGPVDLRQEGACVLDLGRRVAAFEIGLDPVEYRWRNSGIPLRRETIAQVADVMVDPEYLLNDHDAALRPA